MNQENIETFRREKVLETQLFLALGNIRLND